MIDLGRCCIETFPDCRLASKVRQSPVKASCRVIDYLPFEGLKSVARG